MRSYRVALFFFRAADGIRGGHVTGVQTCALPICPSAPIRLSTVGSCPIPAPARLVIVGVPVVPELSRRSPPGRPPRGRGGAGPLVGPAGSAGSAGPAGPAQSTWRNCGARERPLLAVTRATHATERSDSTR